MNRLTKKGNRNLYMANIENTYKAMNKLGQLEDIEEELGIDLITLFKALNNGIYVKTSWTKGVRFYPDSSCDYDGFIFCDGAIGIRFNDYGKEWALTKEELE